jgi:hypothetical protein
MKRGGPKNVISRQPFYFCVQFCTISQNTTRYDSGSMTRSFTVGDRVRWSTAFSSDYKNAEGTIIRIVPVSAMPQFTLYDIRFEFGKHTLLASQIEPAPIPS